MLPETVRVCLHGRAHMAAVCIHPGPVLGEGRSGKERV